MKPSDFGDDSPGQLVDAALPTGQRYWAYVPNPLPPPLRYDDETVALLSEADQALGRLDGIGQTLRDPHVLIGPFLRREAVSSSRIEGTTTDIRRLVMFEADPTEDAMSADSVEVMNYVRALKHGLDSINSRPVTLQLLCEAHELLLAGARGPDKTPGRYRERQNIIGRSGQGPRGARFVPPPVLQMHGALRDLNDYIPTPRKIPTLIDLALIHYQFEAIHPFLGGNGRLGRLLTSLLLRERGCLRHPLLYLSSYLEKNKRLYRDRLLSVSRDGDWTAWIRFFLEGVATQSRAAASRCVELQGLRERYQEEVRAVSSSSKIHRLIDLLFERPSLTIGGAAEALGMTGPGVTNCIWKLEAMGILEEVTGRAWRRTFLATGIIEVIQRSGDSPDR